MNTNFIQSSKTLVISLILTITFLLLISIYLKPTVMGDAPGGLIALEFAFSKKKAELIVQQWQPNAIVNFNKFIFLDYLYPIAYSLFFASLLSWSSKTKAIDAFYKRIITLSFAAGILDWIENSLEIAFLNNMQDFPNWLFFAHSCIAATKFIFLFIVWGVTLYQFASNALTKGST